MQKAQVTPLLVTQMAPLPHTLLVKCTLNTNTNTNSDSHYWSFNWLLPETPWKKERLIQHAGQQFKGLFCIDKISISRTTVLGKGKRILGIYGYPINIEIQYGEVSKNYRSQDGRLLPKSSIVCMSNIIECTWETASSLRRR